jgi:hypothetical protein
VNHCELRGIALTEIKVFLVYKISRIEPVTLTASEEGGFEK